METDPFPSQPHWECGVCHRLVHARYACRKHGAGSWCRDCCETCVAHAADTAWAVTCSKCGRLRSLAVTIDGVCLGCVSRAGEDAEAGIDELARVMDRRELSNSLVVSSGREDAFRDALNAKDRELRRARLFRTILVLGVEVYIAYRLWL